MRRSGGVVIPMQSNFDNIKFIVGDQDTVVRMQSVNPLPVFSEETVSFLNALSRVLIRTGKAFSDVVTFGFWCRCAALLAEKAKYDDVFIVGHSMGSALAILAAAECGIRRIVTACPAISYSGWKPPRPFPVMLLFSLLKKRIPTAWHHQSEYVLYYENAPCDDDYLGGEYWSWVYIREVYELMKLMKEADDALPSLDADILTISGGKDLTVGDKSSLEIMEKGRGQNKHVHIPECTHFLYYDIDKSGEEKAVSATLDWLLR